MRQKLPTPGRDNHRTRGTSTELPPRYKLTLVQQEIYLYTINNYPNFEIAKLTGHTEAYVAFVLRALRRRGIEIPHLTRREADPDSYARVLTLVRNGVKRARIFELVNNEGYDLSMPALTKRITRARKELLCELNLQIEFATGGKDSTSESPPSTPRD